MKKRIVVKLSGKIFAMEETKKLKDYATFFVKKSKICQPIIIAGGGKIARYFISHARSSGADESTLDELGIEISRLNARLLIYALKGKAYPHPPTNLTEVKHAVDSGLIVVTGGLHPGQSTNATAALIAEKIHATEFLNATDVDGIYDLDPNKNKNAKKYKKISFDKVLSDKLKVMDATAIVMCRDNNLPLRVFNLMETNSLVQAMSSEDVGTSVN